MNYIDFFIQTLPLLTGICDGGGATSEPLDTLRTHTAFHTTLKLGRL